MPRVERIGVPPGDKVLHALHDAEHPDLRWVGNGAGELIELRQGRGHVDPATGADDRGIGQAQEVLRLEIERPQLGLALEGPIPVTRARGAGDGVVRQQDIPGAIAEPARDDRFLPVRP